MRTVVDQQRSKGVLILTETQGEESSVKLYGLYDQRLQDITEALSGFVLSRDTKLAVVYSPGER